MYIVPKNIKRTGPEILAPFSLSDTYIFFGNPPGHSHKEEQEFKESAQTAWNVAVLGKDSHFFIEVE